MRVIIRSSISLYIFHITLYYYYRVVYYNISTFLLWCAPPRERFTGRPRSPPITEAVLPPPPPPPPHLLRQLCVWYTYDLVNTRWVPNIIHYCAQNQRNYYLFELIITKNGSYSHLWT